MLDFKMVVCLLCEYGPMAMIAHDRSGLRKAVNIPKAELAESLKMITNLKDGANTWVYSVEIEPSR